MHHRILEFLMSGPSDFQKHFLYRVVLKIAIYGVMLPDMSGKHVDKDVVKRSFTLTTGNANWAGYYLIL